MVNNLLLVERSANARECLRVLTIELEDFLLLVAREAADSVDQSALQLFLRDLHACFLADLGQDQTKTNAALSETLILFARSFLSGVLVLKRATSLLEFARHLCPDVLELSFDQLGRRFELVRLIQSVEELTLCLLAGDRTELILELAANDLAQLFSGLETQLLGESVVDLDIFRRRNLLHGHVEFGFLASQVLGSIGFREGDLEGLLVASLEADQLLFKAGDKLAVADHQL